MTRLTKQWSDEHAPFQQPGLAESDYVYVRADRVHPRVRLGQARSCVLGLTGVRLDGTKELIAPAEGIPLRYERLQRFTSARAEVNRRRRLRPRR